MPHQRTLSPNPDGGSKYMAYFGNLICIHVYIIWDALRRLGFRAFLQSPQQPTYLLLVSWNPTMVWFTWHKHKCTTPIPIQHGLSPSNMIKEEKNIVIRTDIVKLENKITWVIPTTSIGKKMTHYETLFTHRRMETLSCFLIWTYIYPLCCAVW